MPTPRNDSPRPSGPTVDPPSSGPRILFRTRPISEQVSALKERIYASFTGLAIVTVLALDVDHTSTAKAFLTLLAGIVGITLAGFAAEVISHLVSHGAPPTFRAIRTMLRIAAGALASASAALVALAIAWLGVVELETALRIGVALYLATLVVITLIAARQTGLRWHHQALALCGLLALGATVVGVLVLAH
ncbi:hypothetical protein [Herbiconiux ginsengi]|uniref:VIT family protein n=1 Tax=Herbiconiux ginsengi TaxID=381665 RepID=A0A1H3LLK8_9MICO|nr:hypothetical protein [Herbiconiux ginsengi]SDY65226.1 hypothetical protein SAMN05216554_1034 [Herbiconiux ginsengi]